MKKTNIAIIGVGLMGGSLGLALKTKGGYRVTGIGRNAVKLKRAKKLGAVDEYTVDYSLGVRDADIIVLCVPVDLLAGMLQRVLPFVKSGAIVTDVGSVKASIMKGAYILMKKRKDACFIGAHPLAGSEKTGVQFSSKGLYLGASVVITPFKGVPAVKLGKLKKMWKDTGADVLVMSPERHDALVAGTSHLPHVLSALMVKMIYSLNTRDTSAQKLLAGSFRDLTRISDSDPGIWAAISVFNSRELICSIGRFADLLGKFKNLLGSKKLGSLNRFYSQARQERKELLNDNKAS